MKDSINFLTIMTISLTMCLLNACSTIPVHKREGMRQELNDGADKVITKLVAKDPGLQKSIDESIGYFVTRISAAELPVVGGGSGLGVLFDKKDNTRTYMNVTRFDFGVGLVNGDFGFWT